MENYSYDPSLSDEILMLKDQNSVENEDDESLLIDESLMKMSKSQIAHLRESPAARERRLARNAERMREKRARESYDEYRKRLEKNALNNRLKRKCESDGEKAVRHVRDAARQRLRRAMETDEQRIERLGKLAERMRYVRMNESPEKKARRLTKAAQRSRERLLRETSEERRHRLQKSCDYARRIRGTKSSCSLSDTDSSVKSIKFKPKKRSKVSPAASATEVQPDLSESQPVYLQYENVIQKNNKCITLARMPQPNHQYVQFAAPMTYTMSTPQYTIVPQTQTMPITITDANNVNIMIQPISSSYTNAFALPQYAVFMPNPQQEDMSVEVEPVIEMEQPKVRPRGRPRKRSEPTEIKAEVKQRDPSEVFEEVTENEQQRLERLRITAEKSRIRRMHESPAQREKRLKDLKDRARRRREQIKLTETAEERKERLAQQADYARARRLKLSSIGKHEDSQSSDKPSVLKILEPIIEMNS